MSRSHHDSSRRYLTEFEQLTERVQSLNVDRDVGEARSAMRKIVAIVHTDASAAEKLVPCAIRLYSSSDVLTKKLSSWFISRFFRRQSESFLLIINSLLKDTIDSSPIVRVLSLKCLSHVGEPMLTEHAIPVIKKSLQDSSAAVRRAGVLACVRMSTSNHDAALDIVDTLYKMIRDSDSLVVVNSLLALDEILQKEGGIVINKHIARYLADHIQELSDFMVAYTVQVLSRYKPSTVDEALYLMNALDPLLSSTQLSVLVPTVQFFISLSQPIGAHVERDIVQSAKNTLLHMLSALADCPESLFVLLEFTEDLLSKHLSVFQPHHRLFFIKSSDPAFLMLRKISILGQLAGEQNLSEIIEELSLYCRHDAPSVSRRSLAVLGRLARTTQTSRRVADICLDVVDSQLTDEALKLTGKALSVLEEIELTSLSNNEPTLQRLEQRALQYLRSGQHSCEVTCAYVSILSKYGLHINSAPYILEYFVEDLLEKLRPLTNGDGTEVERENEINSEHSVCTNLDQELTLDTYLTAALRLFLVRPAECQHVLAAVLATSCRTSNPVLCQRARLYYELLQTDVDSIRSMLG